MTTYNIKFGSLETVLDANQSSWHIGDSYFSCVSVNVQIDIGGSITRPFEWKLDRGYGNKQEICDIIVRRIREHAGRNIDVRDLKQSTNVTVEISCDVPDRLEVAFPNIKRFKQIKPIDHAAIITELKAEITGLKTHLVEVRDILIELTASLSFKANLEKLNKVDPSVPPAHKEETGSL